MKKLIILTNINEEKDINIEYKTNRVAKAGIIGMIIDLLVIVLFDWWVWIPIWICTAIFGMKVAREVDQMADDVYLLLNSGWGPKTFEDAQNLVNDFKVPVSVIENKSWKAELTEQVVERRLAQ